MSFGYPDYANTVLYLLNSRKSEKYLLSGKQLIRSSKCFLNVHDNSEFKEQLTRNPAGWYETGLPWRGNHATLPNNKQGSLRRLNHLTKRLQRDELTTDYDSIIREQLSEGIVERAPEVSSNKKFYIPHKAVVKESAESAKTRIVYDASAKASTDAPSLNKCLNPGPSFQKQTLGSFGTATSLLSRSNR